MNIDTSNLLNSILEELSSLSYVHPGDVLKSIGHLLEHHRVSVDVRHREAAAGVSPDVLGHGGLSLVGPDHDGLVVVVGRGHHVVAGKEEDGRKAEQGKVDAVVPGARSA